MKRTAIAVWNGTGKEGKGTITTQSKVLDNIPYSWSTRFTEEPGTNPEELIAAAHSGCFTMKLSFLVTEAGYIPEELVTTCIVTLKENTITQSHLIVKAKVPGISPEQFAECAERAKKECPVSKALNIEVTMDAGIESLVKS